MLAQKDEYLRPAIGRLLGPEGGPLGVEEGVTGVGVTMELVSLAETPQHRLGAVDLVGSRVLVVVAKQAEQRSAQVSGEVDGCHRVFGIELALVVDDHIAAP